MIFSELISKSGSVAEIVLFVTGSVLIFAIAGPILQTMIMAGFSLVLNEKSAKGEKNAKQGTMMGLITDAGSLARILLPLSAGWLAEWLVYVEGSISSLLSFLIVCVLLFLSDPRQSNCKVDFLLHQSVLA